MGLEDMSENEKKVPTVVVKQPATLLQIFGRTFKAGYKTYFLKCT